jgi:stearoyl-CoA desaturase (delta-9 desaturase)
MEVLPVLRTATRQADERTNWRGSAPFLACHLVPLAAVFTGVHRRDVILAGALYVGRMFFITAGYHRYFAHRSFRLSRPVQFLFALGGSTAAQKGPLWWAANHREHHRYTDTERDPHSPQKGFWWSHVGWVLSGKYGRVDYDTIDEFARFPELRFVDRHDWIGPWALAIGCFLYDGWSGLVIGFFASTVLLWHVTFSVNSFAHIFGRRRYATSDTSRNSLPVAVLTMGEGWHNNHHHYPASARQGFFWWELDLTFQLLRVLSWVGLVRELRAPSAGARQAAQLRRGCLDVGQFRLHVARAAATAMGRREMTPDTAKLVEALGAVVAEANQVAKVTRRMLDRPRDVLVPADGS